MITVEEAQARLFALGTTIATETVPLADALGRWAVDDIRAKRTQPACDLSAMDGYAIRFTDRSGPWTVTGESAAGQRFSGSVGVNEAVRIFTGAVIPDGADTVIIQENIARDGDTIRLAGDAPTHVGQHVRRCGGDFTEGSTVISKGAELHARRLALAAMAGHDRVRVRRPIRVVLISTGSELLEPGLPCGADQIPSSNAVMIAAMLRAVPAVVEDYGIVADDLDSLKAAFQKAGDADIIVTTGGASVGDHDLVAPALTAAGGTIDFWKIAMRPGKPVIAGKCGNAQVLGLPGNPVSAFVTAYLLLTPLVRHLCGANQVLPPRINAALAVDLPANGSRTDHLRGMLAGGTVAPMGLNDSSMIAALAEANALIIRAFDASPSEQGSVVECYPI